MVRRKTSKSAPDMPVRFFQLPDGQPVAVLSLADFLELLVLGSEGARAQADSPAKEQRGPGLGEVMAGLNSQEIMAQATIKDFLLGEGAMAAVNRSISASLTHPYHAVLSATSGITEPVFAPEDSQEAAEEAADLAAYEEARARDEEAFPLDVTERLVAGVHPIKVFRDYRGMTQAELARQVGLSPMYISQIETGRRGGSTKALRRIAAALDIDLADLVQ